ncbi:unnamed protein product [Cyberlindnera jadinii]|uniref:Iron transport multicopper oxidase FET3 n=1 Tax=Cyberlindnera jadinii (strain ATCC 18201 / CBS 1600 / BCRC 20928 / JCM 3617 / NBRC 0987 / NRRL Y-1542) TaxID=983966 RepID=A0A0H5C0Y0_CYBJN|nr:unnamed protein product [Cyberlindnera jadinii]
MVSVTSLLLAGALASSALAETHVYNWTAAWGTANLDGYERPVITCNGEFPWPDVIVNKGDRVIVHLNNGFDDRNTSLHFHGLFQHGTNQMDGPEMITQCPVPIGHTMTYNFTAPDQIGSYWYHSHTAGQYMDGMRGVMVISEDNNDYPYKQGIDYNETATLTFMEWYHDTADVLIPDFLNLYNPTGAEPIPNNFLMNNTKNMTWEVEPDTTYLLRLVNMGAFVSYWFFIEGHNMTVVEVDGVPVEKYETDKIYITVAQRYTVLITTKDDTSKNYAIMQLVDDGMLDLIPSGLLLNTTHTMSYSSDNAEVEEYYVDCLDDDCYLDDMKLVPYDKVELYDDPDHVITISVIMDNLKNGVNYAFFNNITYTAPKTPTLLTVLAAGDLASNELVYGTNTHTIVLQKDEIVDIVLNNEDTGKHPFHLHGHVFQLIDRGAAVDDDDPFVHFDYDNHTEFAEYPMMRDTVYVRPQSNIVMRFKADNPGVWMFHCHIEWHLVQGLALVLVEAPEEIQNNSAQQLTQQHIDNCEANGINVKSNAAGNTENFLDLTGQNVQHGDIPDGFTGKGIVAMVFSCIAAILGLITIAVYGLMDIKNLEVEVAQDLGVVEDLQNTEDVVVEETSSKQSSAEGKY